jgi:RNase P subunit RPR2
MKCWGCAKALTNAERVKVYITASGLSAQVTHRCSACGSERTFQVDLDDLTSDEVADLIRESQR